VVAATTPRCAVCVAEILGDEKFVLAGTEVFHVRCVKAKGTLSSVGNRRKAMLSELKTQMATLESRAQIAEARARSIESSREIAQAELVRVKEQLYEHTRLVDDYREQRDRARRERDEAVAARDAARRENALMQQVGHQTPQTPTSSDPAAQDDGKDATEKRFSLLELD